MLTRTPRVNGPMPTATVAALCLGVLAVLIAGVSILLLLTYAANEPRRKPSDGAGMELQTIEQRVAKLERGHLHLARMFVVSQGLARECNSGRTFTADTGASAKTPLAYCYLNVITTAELDAMNEAARKELLNVQLAIWRRALREADLDASLPQARLVILAKSALKPDDHAEYGEFVGETWTRK